jgi:hypothetical protein
MCKAKLGAAPLSKGPATSSARFYDSSDESDAHQPVAQPCSAPVYRKRSQKAVQLASQIPLETRPGIESVSSRVFSGLVLKDTAPSVHCI